MSKIKSQIPFYVIMRKNTYNTESVFIDVNSLNENKDIKSALFYDEDKAKEILSLIVNSDNYEIAKGYLSFPNS